MSLPSQANTRRYGNNWTPKTQRPAGEWVSFFEGPRVTTRGALGFPLGLLRAFSHGNVRQLDAVHRRLLAGLAARALLLSGKDVLAYLDIDACQRRVYGATKQGAAFGATKIQGKVVTVRGLNLLASSLSTRTGAPLISGVRLRGGSANCTRGAASFLREQIGTARDAGVTGGLVVRTDSSYYNGGGHAVLGH